MIEDRDLQHQFQAIKADGQDLFAGLSNVQFNWHPSAREWSIADCVEHLGATGRQALSRIEGVISEARALGLVGQRPFRYGLFEKCIVFLAEAPWKRIFKAPKGYVLSTDRAYTDVVPLFSMVQDGFLAALDRAEGIDLSKPKVAHSVTKWLALSLGQYFALHAAHERRHLRQARQIKDDRRFPCSA